MFKKIIFSLFVATGFAAQGMDNRRNDEKSLFESLKDIPNAEDRKLGEQVINKVIEINTPPINKNTKKIGKSSLFVFHPEQKFQKSKL